MPRPLNEIIAQLRMAIANPSISTTLIQTEDTALLCDAADPTPPEQYSDFAERAMTPKNRKVQSFEYYAAHFLVGSGLFKGDLDGNIRALAHELKKQYDLGVEHGQKATDFVSLDSSR